MPLPTELHMPSLDHLTRNLGTLFLNVNLARGGPRDDLLRRHFVNVVRLVDLCVSEYEIARGHLEGSLPDGKNRLEELLRSVDHLELCVITVRRAMNAMESVVRHKGGPAIPRIARRALQAFEGPLLSIRGAVVHVEEEISKGNIEQGQSHALLVSADGRTASIGKHTISLRDLGLAIERLHELAQTLAEYRENGPRNS